MKKLIPFKKEIIFKTNLSEITSISLEHTLSILEENLISGEFIISGDYLMNDNSINTESFSFNIPFDIHMDEKYILDKSIIDINDFYYEIINSKVLEVNIEVSIDKLEEKTLIEEMKVELVEEPFNETILEYEEETEETIKDTKKEERKIEMTKEERCIEDEKNEGKSLFDISVRRNLVLQLKEVMEHLGKQVTITYF